MLTDNPALLHVKINELIERVRDEHIDNQVFAKQQTMNIMRIFLKRQIALLQDQPPIVTKTAEQLYHLEQMDDTFESFYLNLEKIGELQKEKEGLIEQTY
ncbi:MAG: hypothetical protein QF632_04380 [Candidatus Woesearchaeota archaeon]|jgi:hypothetical protein|nr:hypothetical protein [Candidatus Woesearchaeota archaeon]MDP7323968.1 hypothetical protein [Candidatus Woesearchaeota archaeon]MDP7457519.1 hypothetical protein [Candidatus Woesearchaeota archaeon]